MVNAEGLSWLRENSNDGSHDSTDEEDCINKLDVT
jgi:hypothetical protein